MIKTTQLEAAFHIYGGAEIDFFEKFDFCKNLKDGLIC